MADPVEWECEIKIRRNGRMVQRANVLGDDVHHALFGASTDIEVWAESEGVFRSG